MLSRDTFMAPASFSRALGSLALVSSSSLNRPMAKKRVYWNLPASAGPGQAGVSCRHSLGHASDAYAKQRHCSADSLSCQLGLAAKRCSASSMLSTAHI